MEPTLDHVMQYSPPFPTPTRWQYCGVRGGGRVELTLDHVMPVSKGGRNTWLNLVTACMQCNQVGG